ncbi:DUF3237 family protein [Saccharibacillus deserti]|uniref:DUF3237 family protein n=1 Tax=Saccharibacillus deserti TaxID=1634444 RepID=UPI001552BEF9|nr:DUF3237 family protein [Saccharibacillus deserti]
MEKEEVFTVHVAINGSVEMRNAEGNSVVMISFTGHASGPYFEGRVLEGGVDTQIIGPSGTPHTLSARYMLRGTDRAGQPGWRSRFAVCTPKAGLTRRCRRLMGGKSGFPTRFITIPRRKRGRFDQCPIHQVLPSRSPFCP